MTFLLEFVVGSFFHFKMSCVFFFLLHNIFVKFVVYNTILRKRNQTLQPDFPEVNAIAFPTPLKASVTTTAHARSTAVT